MELDAALADNTGTPINITITNNFTGPGAGFITAPVVIPSNKVIKIIGTDGSNVYVFRRGTSFSGSIFEIGENSTLEITDLRIDYNITGSPPVRAPLIDMSEPNSHLILNNVRLSENDNNRSSGGAISMTGAGSSITMNTGSLIAFCNVVAPDQFGGGIYASTGTITINGGTIRNSQAPAGGGIYLKGDATLTMTGGTIRNNTATAGDGGGIYVSRANLSRVNISAGATFSGNTASVPQNRDPKDDAMYNAHIFTNLWTSPYTQGYNNYDIAYSPPPPTPPKPPRPPRPPRPGGGSGGYLSGGAGGYVTWSSNTSLINPYASSAGSSGSAGTGIAGGRYPTSGRHLCRLNCVKTSCGTFCLANCVTFSKPK
ncbi:hypothetical protein AGMMS49992_22440 [Clostridia bacterium]|nr:hypothetical protein AGMMS49992_22440 [Clostridia bacterium]